MSNTDENSTADDAVERIADREANDLERLLAAKKARALADEVQSKARAADGIASAAGVSAFFEQVAARYIAKNIPVEDEAMLAAQEAARVAKERDAAIREQCRHFETRVAALRAGCFPARVTQNIRVLVPTQALTHAEGFAADLPRRSTMLLYGGVGTGKSTAAAWLAWERGGHEPVWIRASELERRGRYDHPFQSWIFGASMLVVDDLGIETLDGKGYFCSLLDELVDTYHADMRTLVLTSNLRAQRATPEDVPQFRERYGERVWSRLQGSGYCGYCGFDDQRGGKS